MPQTYVDYALEVCVFAVGMLINLLSTTSMLGCQQLAV